MSALSPASIFRLPYDDTLTLAGVEYAKKSLHYTYNRMGLNPAARLRKIVAGVAVELAFRRWLDAEAIPYDLLGATAFTEKDRYDLRLGGRRCDVKSFLISDWRRSAALRRDPAWLLEAEALVPEDQFNSAALDENDFYLFGFLAGEETRQSADVKKALQAGRPVYLLYTLADDDWLGRKTWQSLGRLVFKSNLSQPMLVEVGGQDEQRTALVERFRLQPHTRTETEHEFFSLLSVRAPRLPEEVLGVHSPTLKETRLIPPGAWFNIWVYGLEIFMAGWLTKAEFRALGRKLPAGSHVQQYNRTQTDNRAVPAKDLHPLAELAELIKNSEWGRRA
jgi:hypothetical protein